jgi:hypothetical protein
MLGGLVPVCTLPIVAGLIPQNRYNDVNELLGSMSMQGKGIRMTRTMSLQSAGFLALIFLSAATPVLADDCTYLSAFRQAIQNKDIQAAKGLEAKIAVDAVCGPLTNRVRLQRVLLETATAETLLERPGREAEREALLTSAA